MSRRGGDIEAVGGVGTLGEMTTVVFCIGAGLENRTLCFGTEGVVVCTLCFGTEVADMANGTVVSRLNPGGGDKYSDWPAVSIVAGCDGRVGMGATTGCFGAVNGCGSIANMVSMSLGSGAGG